jgi:hypothetical protein
MLVQWGAEDHHISEQRKGPGMDAQKCFEVALDHYRKGNELLNYPVAVLIEEQALHTARASAHFAAGTLALALAGAPEDASVQPAP